MQRIDSFGISMALFKLIAWFECCANMGASIQGNVGDFHISEQEVQAADLLVCVTWESVVMLLTSVLFFCNPEN